MKLSDIGRQGCPMAQGLAQIGDAWSLLILREVFYGRNRFSDFVTYTGAQKTVVSARLKQLVDAGILAREAYSELPTRHRYVPTEKGRDLAKVLVMLTEWGTRWVDDDHQHDVALTHSCGERFEAAIHCRACGDEVTEGSIGADPHTTVTRE